MTQCGVSYCRRLGFNWELGYSNVIAQQQELNADTCSTAISALYIAQSNLVCGVSYLSPSPPFIPSSLLPLFSPSSSALPPPVPPAVTNDTVKVEVWDIVDKGGCGHT